MKKYFRVVCGTLLMASLGTVCAWCREPPQSAEAPSAGQQPFSSNGTIRIWNMGRTRMSMPSPWIGMFL